MTERRAGTASQEIRLCVDSYCQGVMEGRVFHPELQNEGRRFCSMPQLLLTMETIMDETDAPQSYTAKRSFVSRAESRGNARCDAGWQEGRLGTFSVRVLFRQHASWQGTVTWLEGRGEQRFRSALELILLIDGALGGCFPDSRAVCG